MKAAAISRFCVALMIGCSSAALASAEPTAPRMPYQEHADRIKSASAVSPLRSDLFGDGISLYNGATTFSAVDIDLPGNNALPVRLARRLSIQSRPIDAQILGGFGTWDIDIPYISGTFATTNNWMGPQGNGLRCSEFHKPPGYYPFGADEIYSGVQLSLQDGGAQEVLRISSIANMPLPTDGFTYALGTRDMHRIRCKASTANGFPGEAFIVKTAEGLIYTLDVAILRNAGDIEKPIYTAEPVAYPTTQKMTRNRIYLAASRIEDRFGNWVSYQWTGDKLTGITSSDGRAISIAWSGTNITSATAHGRTWNYTYGSEELRVTRPDSSYWLIQQSGSMVPGYPWPGQDSNGPGCAEPPRALDASLNPPPRLTMRHPSGATGTFEFSMMRHGRAGVPASACAIVWTWHGHSVYELAIPNYFDVFSISTKTITGPGLAEQRWTYDYEVVDYSLTQSTGRPCPDCQDTKSVWVREPDGTVQEHRFGALWEWNDGRLLGTYTRATDNTIARSVEHTYVSTAEAASMPFPDMYGAPTSGDDGTTYLVRPIRKTVTSQDGFIPDPAYHNPGMSRPQPQSSGAPTSTFTSETQSFDGFARAISISRFSDLGYSKDDTVSYHDDRSLWVLGQPRLSATNGTETQRTDYNVHALPSQSFSFGKLQQSFSYSPDGTILSITDGRSNSTSFGSWHRGIPTHISYADGTRRSATVNDSGWITGVTDENGYSTGYAYDAMGRLASTTYPTSDSTEWNVRHQLLTQITDTDWRPPGFSVGQWKQLIWQGNYRKITYLDALWRPTLVHEYDNADISGTLIATSTVYDASGRVAFQSYPSDTAIPTALGVRTEYDVLGRTRFVRQDSEHGVLTTETQYLPQLQTLVTNPRGYQTRSAFVAYDKPSHDMLAWSVAPEGANVIEIGRNVFDRPIWLRQRSHDGSLSVTRNYVYDQHMQLCKSVEPETRATVMDYDAAGNLQWSASGLELMDPNSCDTIAGRDSPRKVARAHDSRNRLVSLDFPDDNGDQSFMYYPDGLIQRITTLNDNGATSAINAYEYNKRRLLTGESISQPGWYVWSAGYGYDPNGNLATLSYPSGLSLSYAPNALGQPTRVTSSLGDTFATAVGYYPNGAIRQFIYGNGIVHTMEQNARQLPLRVTSSSGISSYEYGYDQNGNVAHAYDLNRGTAYSRWMEYDALDRLTKATSASFGGDNTHRLTYDALDNIRSWILGGNKAQFRVKDHANYWYNPTNNRLESIRNSGGATVIGLDYDPAGNLRNKNGVMHHFDLGNRLRGIDHKESYRYDGHGRRVLAWSPTGGSILSMYSHSGQLLYEHNERTWQAGERIYLAGSLIATRDYDWSTGQYTYKYQHTDALGSPIAVTNEAGQVLERTDWEPYGAAIGKPAYQGIGYTGHVMDGATGLTYMQQRYYDPTIGRFLSVDPVAARVKGDNFNRYWYANNNAYKFLDPDGRQSIEYGPNAAPLSSYSEQVLRSNMKEAGVAGITVTSTYRPPAHQARVMYENARKYGVKHQMALYGAPGRQVIQAYADAVNEGLSNNDTIARMTNVIQNQIETDPDLYKHSQDPARLDTADIAPSSVEGSQASLIRKLRSDSRVSNVITPPKDPAIHVEIPQARNVRN